MTDVRLVPLPRLRAIVTTGWRAWVRNGVRLALVVSLALAAVGVATERHRPCFSMYHPGQPHAWGESRAIVTDLAPWLLGLLGAAILAQVLAHRGRLLAAVVIGPLTAVVAMRVLMAMVWIHARAHTLGDWALAAPALLVATAIGMAQLLLEPWLALAERRAAAARVGALVPSS